MVVWGIILSRDGFNLRQHLGLILYSSWRMESGKAAVSKSNGMWTAEVVEAPWGPDLEQLGCDVSGISSLSHIHLSAPHRQNTSCSIAMVDTDLVEQVFASVSWPFIVWLKSQEYRRSGSRSARKENDSAFWPSDFLSFQGSIACHQNSEKASLLPLRWTRWWAKGRVQAAVGARIHKLKWSNLFRLQIFWIWNC